MERKRLIILIIILIALAVFFFPKHCGNWGTAIHPDVKYQECTCLGVTYREAAIGGGSIQCYGIPLSYYCWHYDSAGEKETIPC